MKDIEKVISQVNGTMAIEGMPLTAEDKRRIRTCAGDSKQVEKAIAELVKKHSAKR